MQVSKGLKCLGVSALPFALICTATTPALAEESVQAGATTPEESSDKEQIVLEEILVTARRREESLQAVPASVTAISGQTLAAEGVRNVIDLQFHTPGLTTVGAGGSRTQTNFAMRGQTQTYGGAFPGVASYFADVPLISQATASFLDIQSVQVLKGPQGTLFGRNTTGGAVLFVPQRPTSEFGGYVMAKLGNYDLRQAEGVLNVPIVSDVLAVRLSGQRIKRDGYTLNLTDGTYRDDINSQTYRGSVLLTPTSDLANFLVVEYSRVNDSGGSFMMNAVRPNSLVAQIYPDTLQFVQTQNARGPRLIESDVSTFNKSKQLIIVNETTYEISSDFSIKNIFGYQRFDQNFVTDQDGSPFNILWSPQSVHNKLVTDELQISGKALHDNLSFIGGLYYEKLSPTGVNAIRAQIFGNPNGIASNQRRDGSKAIYAQGTYDLSGILSGLKFTAGGRYTWDTRKLDLLDGTPDLTAKFRAPTYNFSLDYRIDPNVLVYIATRRGYKSGGFNAHAPTPELTAFQPEYITDYEAGIKADWHLNGMAGRTNISVYTGNYTDIQENEAIPVNGQLLTATLNAASGTIRGADFETNIRPASWLNLSAFYSYTDAFYKSFPSPEGDATASKFANTPRTKLGATAEITAPVGDDYGRLSFRASYYYQSHQYFWDLNFNNPESRAPGYDLVNLRAEWSNIAGKPLSLAFFGTNIFNTKYMQQGNPLAVALGFNSVAYGDPRMYGAELRFDF